MKEALSFLPLFFSPTFSIGDQSAPFPLSLSHTHTHSHTQGQYTHEIVEIGQFAPEPRFPDLLHLFLLV